MLPRALLLDAGNTIVFFDVEAAATVLREAGHVVAPAALRAAEGPAKRRYERELREGGAHADSWFTYMSTLLDEAGVTRRDDATHTRELVATLRREHDRFNLWRSVPAGVAEALDRARDAGTVLGVVSNSEGHIAELLEAVGLASRFAVIVDSAIEGVQKPDPIIWHRALERIRVAPEDALYAGDVPSVDVEGARGAGLAAVLIDTYAQYDDDPRIRDADGAACDLDPRVWRSGPIVRFGSVVALLDALQRRAA